jgi:hypothetical protein
MDGAEHATDRLVRTAELAIKMRGTPHLFPDALLYPVFNSRAGSSLSLIVGSCGDLCVTSGHIDKAFFAARPRDTT